MPSKILKLGEKNEDPGPWPTNILEIGTVGTRKKPCPLCGLWFAEENLTGMSSLKTVLTLKVKWGVKGANEKLTDRQDDRVQALHRREHVRLLRAAHHAGPGGRRRRRDLRKLAAEDPEEELEEAGGGDTGLNLPPDVPLARGKGKVQVMRE